jgi:PhnB protein
VRTNGLVLDAGTDSDRADVKRLQPARLCDHEPPRLKRGRCLAVRTRLEQNSMKIHSYLNFDNKTEEAFRFYEKALGGKLTEIHRFGSMPQQEGVELTPEQKNLVMHVALELPDGQMIMASDMLAGMGPKRVEGNNISISVHPDSKQEADRIFNALAQGGTITMPIANQFWGDYFGSLTDRFGINWMVNYSDPATRQQ